MKLLLIDDQPDILNLILREFRKHSDISIDVATRGADGIVRVGGDSYDAIILDYSLPDMDGLEVLKRLYEKCRSPVVIVTGQGNEEIAAEAIKLGAFDYVTKTIGYIEKLPWIIDNVIKRHRLCSEKIELEGKISAQSEYLQALFNDMEESVVVIDRELNIIDANNAFLKDSGYRREDVIGNKCYRISHGATEPCRPPDHDCPVTAVIASGTASQALHLHEDKHGNRRYIEISASPIRYEGAVERVIEIARDISKRVELEQELIKTNEELENKMSELQSAYKTALHTEKLASIGRLAAGIAHEINNPLANASLNMQMLQSALKLSVGDEHVLRRIEAVGRNIDRASTIAKELLLFSRQSEFEAVPSNINDVIVSVLLLMEHKLGNIAVSRDLSDIPVVHVDPVKLEQVFMNILDNAVEAMPHGGDIFISTSHAGGSVEVKISDKGGGIPEEHLSRVFDPFFTTKEVGSGTGLGLSICYGIIKRHNGAMEISSSPGDGTTIVIKLPLSENYEKNSYSR